MKSVFVCVMLVGCGAQAQDAAKVAPASSRRVANATYNFEKDRAGQPPAGFTSYASGSQRAGKWLVQAMPDAPGGKQVVQQMDASGSGNHFPILIANQGDFSDVDVSVRGKALAGQEDQAIGLVFRYRDPKNYYVVRANALEDNVRLYKMVDGHRLQFAGAETKVTSGQWHTLRAVAKGTHITCTFDGKALFEADDSTYASGKVGLWTKADSVTAFDDLQAKTPGKIEP